MKKLLSLVLALLMVVTMIAGCGEKTTTGSTSSAASTSAGAATSGFTGTFDGTIKIGEVSPLTGASAESGVCAKQGIDLAVKERNAAGGVVMNGKHYEIKVFHEDSAGAPETAVAAAEKLLGVDKVDVIFAETLLSSCILAVMDLCPKYPDVVFSTIEGVSTGIPQKYASDPAKYANFFKPEWSADTYGKAVAQGAQHLVDKGVIPAKDKTVAYIYEDTDYGRSNVEASKKEFSAGGWKSVADEVSPQGTTDFYAQINKIKSLKPDVVVSCFVPEASGVAYLKQVAEIGVDWSDYAIVYPQKPNFYEDAGSACANLFWTPIMYNEEAPEIVEFTKKIKDEYGVSLNEIHLMAYDVTNMMLDAIEKAGTTSATGGLSEAYGSMQYDCFEGKIVFDENHCAIGGEGYLTLSTGQVNADGTGSKIVWPEDMAQVDPVAQR